MAKGQQKISSIGDIRTCLVGVIKSWNQQTSELTWPEGDTSMAAMDGHIFTLRAVNAQLATIEGNRPLTDQKSLLAHFDRESVQDPGKFASFATTVGMMAA